MFLRLWRIASGRHRATRLLALLPARLRELAYGASVLYGRDAADPARPLSMAVVTHELTASGVPAVAMEIGNAGLAWGADVAVFSPTRGPFLDPMLRTGASVVVDPTLTSYLCTSSSVLDEADVVIVNSAVCFPTVLRLRRPERCIWYFHETGLIDELKSSTSDFQRAVRRPRRIWAVSERTRRRLADIRGDVEIVPPGMAYTPAPPGPEGRTGSEGMRLALIGAVEPRKGHDLLLDAMLLIPAPVRRRISIIAYGPIRDQPFADAWRQSLTRCPEVAYGGVLAPERVMEELRSLDGVVIPSRDEPFPLVAVEAMSIGKIILCTAKCGISERLTDAVDGFVAAAPDPVSLADLLQRALAAKERWPEIGLATRRLYEATLSREVFARRIREELDMCDRQSRSGPPPPG